MTYAENTTVSSEKSRTEIERTLTRYGATGFLYAWGATGATVAFQMSGRQIKFKLPMPSVEEFGETPTGLARSASAMQTAHDQAIRQRWRALALCIKAKLETIESGITEFDDEFMAHIVMPDGKTVGEIMVPQIAIAYDTGNMPPLLPDYSSHQGARR